MTLTQQQLITFGTDIRSKASSMGWNLETMAEEIAAYYNGPNSGFIVWRTAVSPEAWAEAIMNGGGAAQLDNLTVGKRDALLWCLGWTINPSLPVVRTSINDLVSTQTVLKNSLLAASKRTASKIEKLLASGTGTDASPATMGFEGAVLYSDVEAAIQATG